MRFVRGSESERFGALFLPRKKRHYTGMERIEWNLKHCLKLFEQSRLCKWVEVETGELSLASVRQIGCSC